MQILDCEQRSDEWYKARTAIFTASEFSKIITPTGKKSTLAEGMTNRIIAEMLLKRSHRNFTGNFATERGEMLEPDAVDCYQIITGENVQPVGFFIADDGYYGASPDGLVGDDGLLEIKCVYDESHVGNMLGDEPHKPYYPQLQGQLLVTGRKWVDLMSYHPELPPVIKRVVRDEDYLAKLAEYLEAANDLLKSKKRKLAEMGYLNDT